MVPPQYRRLKLYWHSIIRVSPLLFWIVGRSNNVFSNSMQSLSKTYRQKLKRIYLVLKHTNSISILRVFEVNLRCKYLIEASISKYSISALVTKIVGRVVVVFHVVLILVTAWPLTLKKKQGSTRNVYFKCYHSHLHYFSRCLIRIFQ